MQNTRQRKLSERQRFFLGWALGAVVLLSCTRGIWWPGIGVALVGLLIRIWAASHIQKNVTLCTQGPYRYTRNPLYLGSMIMAIGFCLAVQRPVLLGCTFLFFLLVYYPVIFREEERLKSKFPDAWSKYYQSVPRLVPNPLRRSMDRGESATLWMRGIRKEKQCILGFTGAVLAMMFLGNVIYPRILPHLHLPPIIASVIM
ncbi:MAG: isoprenylcysteine carboxylmethyltransferase family protein [bacterium]